MKVATIIVRILLGLMFVVFGANAFLKFMPMPELPPTPGGNFIRAMAESGYIYAVGAVELAGGALLLLGRFVPLGLTLLGPIVVNIVLYHVFMDPSGMAVAAVVAVLAAFLVWRYRDAFAGLLQPRRQRAD
jgi:uncharacterized membrane protein YphA (DoxX/SURF4 family)